jgi:hypothetical protein
VGRKINYSGDCRCSSLGDLIEKTEKEGKATAAGSFEYDMNSGMTSADDNGNPFRALLLGRVQPQQLTAWWNERHVT